MSQEIQSYQNKIDVAIKLLRTVHAAAQQPIELSYSGGKDSDVILTLARSAGIPFRPIYKNTTIDPPGTIAHCLSNGVEVVQPKYTFLELIEKKGLPTRRARFCCRYLKEYKILDYSIQGIRRSESVKRASRYSADEPIICRFYGSKKRHVQVILPILNWTDEDVARFISDFNIKCHSLYYDQDGSFDVSKRLGCIGCPLQADQGLNDYTQYPKLFVQVAKAAQVWWDTHPTAKSHTKFGSIYDLLAHNLLFTTYEAYYTNTYTLFGRVDWKEKLSEILNIKLP